MFSDKNYLAGASQLYISTLRWGIVISYFEKMYVFGQRNECHVIVNVNQVANKMIY